MSASGNDRPHRSTADYSLGKFSDPKYYKSAGWNGAGRNKDFHYPRDAERTSTKAVVGSFLAERGDEASDFLLRSLHQYKRKDMSEQTTKDMLAYAEERPNKQTQAHFAVFSDRWDNPEGEKGLRELGVSRNHILADSSIAAILHESAYQAFAGGFDEHQQAAMQGFFGALAGDDHEAAHHAFEAFSGSATAATEHEKAALLHRSIHTISLSMGNLRFGQDKMNTDIGGFFDPNVDKNGEFTHRTQAIREATAALAHNKIVNSETVYMSISAPMDKRTGTLVNSSSTVDVNR